MHPVGIMGSVLLIIYKTEQSGAPVCGAPDWVLLRLQVGVFAGYILDAGTVLLGVKIVMTNDRCTRIAAVKVCQ